MHIWQWVTAKLNSLTIRRINRLRLLACPLAAISREGLASALVCYQSGIFHEFKRHRHKTWSSFDQLLTVPIAIVFCRRCWRYVPHVAARIKMPTSFSGAVFGSPGTFVVSSVVLTGWMQWRCGNQDEQHFKGINSRGCFFFFFRNTHSLCRK